jgi:hypothetical protein
MKAFDGYVYLCNNTEEYIQNIEKALSDSGNKDLEKKRTEFAMNHTWENSVKKIYESIKTVKK